MTRESGIRLTVLQATWLLAMAIGAPLGILTLHSFGDEVALRRR